MKLIAIIACGLLLASCRPKPASPDSIEPGKALAGARLGMNRDELSQQLGSAKQTIGPDRNGRLALGYPGGFSVVCDSNSVVVSVQAGQNFKGKTREGIGIGSSKADVVRAFGVPDKTEPNTDTSASICYHERGLRLKISTNGNVEHITVRPQGNF